MDADEEETTGVTNLRAEAARAGILELVDVRVAEMLRKYNRGQ